MVMFVRHRSGPFYLGFEIAHWRFLRQSGDQLALKGFDTDDVVVDSQDELLWRLRAMYGLKNAKGTKMLTIGGLEAYSPLAQENGPRVAKEVWGYEFVNVTDEEFARRLSAARADDEVVRQVEAQTAALLSRPNVKLETERKFVFNSYLALHVCRQLLQETGASNFGFARCMGHDADRHARHPAVLRAEPGQRRGLHGLLPHRPLPHDARRVAALDCQPPDLCLQLAPSARRHLLRRPLPGAAADEWPGL